MIAFITIIITHWVADFIFQAEEWALGKSKALLPLLKHTCVYSSIWFISTYFIYGDVYKALAFVGITFIAHTLTDFITSKIVSKKFANKELGGPIPNTGAFSWIGFDQVLHYLQLIGTWYVLFGI